MAQQQYSRISISNKSRAYIPAQGMARAKRFDADAAIDGYLHIYRQVIERKGKHER